MFEINIAHRDAIRQKALTLLCQGYHVKARLEGWFEMPEYIYGYRPDIMADKKGKVLIIEIEKGDEDWPKIFALKRFTKERPNTDLEIIPLDK